MKTHSITRRLIGGVLAAEFLCIASFAIVATAHEMHGRRRGFDVMLRGRVDSLLGAVHDADPNGNIFLDARELAPPAEDIYVAASAGGIVGSSQQLPPDALAAVHSSQSGFLQLQVERQGLSRLSHGSYTFFGPGKPGDHGEADCASLRYADEGSRV